MRRVLHVLRRLDPGGIEYWLRDLVMAGGVPGFEMEFLVETADPGQLELDFTSHGAKVHRWTRGNWLALRRLIETRAIHAIHSHVHAFSGLVLSAAKLAGVPVRLAHSHCRQDGRESPARRLYFTAMRGCFKAAATMKLAVSRAAGISLFGSDDFRVLPCARRFTEVSPAHRPKDGRLILGHVGRFTPEKNHQFLFRIASRLNCQLLLSSNASPQTIYSAADVFVFPSLQEGLGLALIEAQAAGLPCVISDGVPEEAIVVPGLVQQLPLSAGEDAWAAAIVQAAESGRRADALDWVLRSPYNLDTNIAALAEVYASGS